MTEGIVQKHNVNKERARRPRRAVAQGDIVIPRKGVWADEQCVVMGVERKTYGSNRSKMVQVLLPNGATRWYPLAEIKEIIPGKEATLAKAQPPKTEAEAPRKTFGMKAVLEPVSGTSEEQLDRARAEVERALGFRGTVTDAKVDGKRIVVEFEVNPEWDLPMPEKVSSLKLWIPSHVRTIFRVRDLRLKDGRKAKG